MKKTKKQPMIITIKGKDYSFKARIPIWKAYLILADLEKQKYDSDAHTGSEMADDI